MVEAGPQIWCFLANFRNLENPADMVSPVTFIVVVESLLKLYYCRVAFKMSKWFTNWAINYGKNEVSRDLSLRCASDGYLSLYSLSGKASYHQISWNLGAARLDVIMIASLWNLTGILATLLPWGLPNFEAIGKVLTRTLWLREFTRSCGKTPVRSVNRGPGK